MDNLELLRLYRRQNPVKYIQKYGDVTPEEAVSKLTPNKPFNLNGVTFEVAEKANHELEFGQAIVAPEVPVEPTPAEPAAKKPVRKPKQVTES